jgi:hypothetical protein
LDWLIGNVALTNATLILTNGVAIGVHDTLVQGVIQPAGIRLFGGAKLISEGSPANLNRVVRYRAVQECPTAPYPTAYCGLIYSTGSYSPAPEVRLRFTELSLLAKIDDSDLIKVPTSGSMTVRLNDCWLHGGTLQATGGSGVSVELVNCLLSAVRSTFDCGNVLLLNNTFDSGTADLNGSSGETYTVKDNLFDQTVLYNTSGGTWSHGYNGYVREYSTWNYYRLSPNASTDVTLTSSPSYSTGPLGSFYLPSSTSLINAGSRTGSSAGLYHYTTQTSQTKEGTSTVDIGFHYVAADGNGNPNDYDSDGVPDYLEDLDGDGTVDYGESNWQSASDTVFRVSITEPKGNSNLP